MKWLFISEDSEPVGEGIGIEAEPGEIPNIVRTIHQSGWASPQGSLWAGVWSRLKGPRAGARASEVGSGYLPKAGSSSVF